MDAWRCACADACAPTCACRHNSVQACGGMDRRATGGGRGGAWHLRVLHHDRAIVSRAIVSIAPACAAPRRALQAQMRRRGRRT
eukprot:scaffold27231_cov34-Phaeocystis_antarctica.AAC.1